MHVWKTLKVFVSSTFLDLELERDRLANIFGRIRQEVSARRLSLIPYDLRWREKHAQQSVVKWCMEMVNRCQYFVCLLGYRYGWRPPEDAQGRPNHEKISVTEMEIEEAFLHVAKDKRFFCIGDMTQYTPEQLAGVKREDIESLEALKERLRLGGETVFEFKSSSQMLEIVETKLRHIINGDYPEEVPLETHTRQEALRELMEEKERGFVGRQRYLSRLDDFATQTEGDNYLLVHAVAGTGKSSLLAKFIADWRKKSNVPVIYHFLNAGADSRQVRAIMIGLAQQLQDLGWIADALPEDPIELRALLRNVLENTDERLIVAIDGLDEIEPAGHELLWLPRNIPSLVRVIVTTRPVAPWQVLQKYPKLNQMELPPLEDTEIDEIILAHAAANNMSLSAEDGQILKKRARGNPLFLKVALEEIGSGGMAVGQLATSIESLFEQILKRLAFRYGEEIIFDYLGLIAGSFSGIAESELREIFSDTSTTSDLADNILLVTQALANFIIERSGLLQFFHPEFERIILQTLGKAAMRRYHRRLSTYFDKKGLAYQRSLLELCYQQQWGQEYERLLSTLTDLEFLEAKCNAGMIDNLVDDFQRALNELSVPIPQQMSVKIDENITVSRYTLRLLAKAIDLDLRFIRRHPQLVFQSLWNRCYWYDAPDVREHYRDFPDQPSTDRVFPLVEKWRRHKDERGLVWLKSRRPLEPHLNSPVYKILHGHNKEALSVALRPDGRRVASGSQDKTVRIWDTQSGDCLLVMESHEQEVESVAFSKDGTKVASAAGEWWALLWDAESGECLQMLETKEGAVRCVTFMPDNNRVVAGISNGTIVIWDVHNAAGVGSFSAHAQDVLSVAVSKDGKFLATGSNDTTARIFEIATGKCHQVLQGHEKIVTCVAWSDDGKWLASASKDHTVRIWNAQTGVCVHVLTGHEEKVNSVSFTPDGIFLLSGGHDNSVRLWQIATEEVVTVFSQYDWQVTGISLNAEGTLMACCARDSTISLWDIRQRKTLPMLQGHQSAVEGMCFDHNKGKLLSASMDSTVREWDLTNARCVQILKGDSAPILNIALSEDGDKVATASENGLVRVWDLISGVCIRCFAGHKGVVSSAFFHWNDRCVVSVGFFDKTIRIWSIADNMCQKILEGHERWIQSIAFSCDPDILASASRDKTVRIWNMKSGRCLKVLRGHAKGITITAFSSDGTFLASGGHDGVIHVWDVQTGGCLMILRGHKGHIVSLAFSPDNQKLYSCSDVDSSQGALVEQYISSEEKDKPHPGKQATMVWDLRSSECVQTIAGKTDVTELAKGSGDLVSVIHDWETAIISKSTGKPQAFFSGVITPASIFKAEVLAGKSSSYIAILELKNYKPKV